MKYQSPRFHKSLGTLSSLTIVPTQGPNSCWRDRGRRKLRVRGLPLLRGALAVALTVLGVHVTGIAASYKVIHSFGAPGDGYNPHAGLVEGRDGKLYGTTPVGGGNGVGNVFRIDPKAAGPSYGYEVITNFPAGLSGGSPYAGLVLGRDGAFYGLAMNGSSNGYGAVFKLEFNQANGCWSCSAVYGFANNAAGCWGALIEDKDAPGVFYGTTQYGGVGRGTVFSLTNSAENSAELTVLGNFNETDGDQPLAALVEGNDGYLYGTTYLGGSHHQGTVFRIEKINPGPIQALHHFSSFPTDGDRLYAALIEGNDGMLYGTAAYGGIGGGIVFRLNKGGDGSGYEVLRIFQGGADAGHPWQAALVERRDGVLMGATSAGGTFGDGTIFKLNKAGTGYAVIRSFTGAPEDGAYPNGTLVRGRDGAYYGTTKLGGANENKGTIFRVGAPGDLDGDLDVDGGDFPIFNDAYRVRDTSYIQDCDFNRSLRVNLANYRTWYRFYKEAHQP